MLGKTLWTSNLGYPSVNPYATRVSGVIPCLWKSRWLYERPPYGMAGAQKGVHRSEGHTGGNGGKYQNHVTKVTLPDGWAYQRDK